MDENFLGDDVVEYLKNFSGALENFTSAIAISSSGIKALLATYKFLLATVKLYINVITILMIDSGIYDLEFTMDDLLNAENKGYDVKLQSDKESKSMKISIVFPKQNE